MVYMSFSRCLWGYIGVLYNLDKINKTALQVGIIYYTLRLWVISSFRLNCLNVNSKKTLKWRLTN